MAKFDIKTVKPKFVVTTSPENKIDVVVNKPIIESKNSKSFFQLKNTGGPKGEKGDQGEPGQNATITVASTSTGAPGTDASVVNQGTEQDAQLAFTIPRGDKGDKGDTGAAGFTPKAWVARGDDYAQIFIEGEHSTSQAKVYDGTDGQDGQAATITVASTSTLPAGSPATVENVGSSSAASLAFGIPKGDTGAAGADGQAATIQVGQVETLEPNQQAYVQNVGSSSQAIFNIGIPKGPKGDSGSGSGDMTASVYDPNGTVAAAGGIPDYVDSNGGKIDTIKVNGTAQTITNKMVDISVPTKTSDLTNDGSDNTSTYVEADELATVATSGSYNDLSNKPTIPAAQVNSDWSANSGVAQILNKPNLATVATSGSYSDLSNKPTIPTVNDATLIIQKNGTDVQTFTANQSTNATANIIVPTQFSDLSGTVGTSQIADGAVTTAKLSDTGWIDATPYINTAYFAARGNYLKYRILGGVVYWVGEVYCHTAPNNSIADLLQNLPAQIVPNGQVNIYGAQYLVPNSQYSVWAISSGSLVVNQLEQNIPATDDYQGYILSQLSYISSQV